MYVPADELILTAINYCLDNNGQIDIEKLEIKEIEGKWEYPEFKFTSMNSIVSYLLGQRSYLISWISGQDTNNQKRIKKIIGKIEKTVDDINKIY